jgi:hypothetical protein
MYMGRDASATTDSALEDFDGFQNEGDKRGYRDPRAGRQSDRRRTARREGATRVRAGLAVAVFVTAQHGDNVTYELIRRSRRHAVGGARSTPAAGFKVDSSPAAGSGRGGRDVTRRPPAPVDDEWVALIVRGVVRMHQIEPCASAAGCRVAAAGARPVRVLGDPDRAMTVELARHGRDLALKREDPLVLVAQPRIQVVQVVVHAGDHLLARRRVPACVASWVVRLIIGQVKPNGFGCDRPLPVWVERTIRGPGASHNL